VIELRWLVKISPDYADLTKGKTFDSRFEKVLQYRVLRWHVDAGGAINVTGNLQWSDWLDVPNAGGDAK
jgi:hypothetical protein